MAAHLAAAGFAANELLPFSVPDHPQEGGLVAIYPGRDTQQKAMTTKPKLVKTYAIQ